MSANALGARRGAFTLHVPAFAASSAGTAVLGPNGAGKTTLLLVLAGLIPSDGSVDRPRRCASVFARPAVMRGSVLWNVAAIVRSVLGTNGIESAGRARTVLRDVGLTGTDADARALSTGQRQRLALARALACEPQALFLDEPFAHVDADARPALRALVAAYCARTGCDLIVATSSFADVAALCAESIVLERGRVTYRAKTAAMRGTDDPYVRALVAESWVVP